MSTYLNRNPSGSSTLSTSSTASAASDRSNMSTSTTATTSTAKAPTKDTRDPLPTDKVALEGILNYHLSQLGILYRRLVSHNAEIDTDRITYENLAKDPGKQVVASAMAERIKGWVEYRNSRAGNVMFHRGEVVRIERCMKKMREGSGGVWSTPDW
jgi:hypothetical protein